MFILSLYMDTVINNINNSVLQGSMLGLWKTVKIYHSHSQSHVSALGFNEVITSSQQMKNKQNNRSLKTDNLQRRAKTLESLKSCPKKHGIHISITQSQEQTSPKRIKVISSNKNKPVSLITRQSSNHSESHQNVTSTQTFINKTIQIKTSPYLNNYNEIKSYQNSIEQKRNTFFSVTTKNKFDNSTNRDSNEQLQRQQTIYFTISNKKTDRQKQNTTIFKLENNINSTSNNMRSTIDSFHNSSFPQNKQKQISIMRLSSNDYNNVKPSFFQVEQQQSSDTCSQQLDKPSFMHGYIDAVTESIIVNKISLENKIKTNQSSKGLHNIYNQADSFKPSASTVNQRDINSPTLNFRKRNKEQTINLYDKKTIVSRSIYSQTSPKQPQVDESTIIQHEISSKFDPLPHSIINLEQCRILLVKQKVTGMLFSAKQIPEHRTDIVNDQLRMYQYIEQYGLKVDILSFYQLYIHHGLYVLIKQPYQLTLQQFINQTNQQSDQIIDLIFKSIQNTLLKIVAILKHKSIQLIRPINVEDIIFKLEEWKLHSPNMFGITQNGISVDQAMKQLRKQIKVKIKNYPTNRH